jgi:Phytanoyl-CoA dioxygenase (PhyH)
MDWCPTLAASGALSDAAASQLQEQGYLVLPGAIPPRQIASMQAAYTAAVQGAAEPDLRIGRSSTRLADFVNRGPLFDDLYVFPPLLAAACLILGRPFKLSSFQARTLHAGAPAHGLHVDVPHASPDWPLLGFIVMVDEFRADNGATCFLPGSQHGPDLAPDSSAALGAEVGQRPACGAVGSMLVFNGSTWHGHGANVSGTPRRSLQGAFIPRTGRAGTDFGSRMSPATRERLSPLAHYLLALSPLDQRQAAGAVQLPHET